MPVSFKIVESEGQRVISLDDEIFDWGLDDDSICKANEQPDLKSVHSDIREHFLESLSELLGFRLTMAEVNEALKRGQIE